MWPYSDKKKRAKVIAEYSTLKPETNSDSPSAKSKGALLVSAKEEIKNITKAGNKGKKNQISFWANTIFDKFKEPALSTTEIKIKPIETS